MVEHWVPVAVVATAVAPEPVAPLVVAKDFVVLRVLELGFRFVATMDLALRLKESVKAEELEPPKIDLALVVLAQGSWVDQVVLVVLEKVTCHHQAIHLQE